MPDLKNRRPPTRATKPLLVGIVVTACLSGLMAWSLSRPVDAPVDQYPFLSIGGGQSSVLLARVTAVTPPQFATKKLPSYKMVSSATTIPELQGRPTLGGTADFEVIRTLAGKPVARTIEIDSPTENRPSLTSSLPNFDTLKVGQYWILTYLSSSPYSGPIDLSSDLSLTGRPLKEGPNCLWMHEFYRHKQILSNKSPFAAMRTLAAIVFDSKEPGLARVAAYKTIDQVVQRAADSNNPSVDLLAAFRDRIDAQANAQAERDPVLRNILYTAQYNQAYPW